MIVSYTDRPPRSLCPLHDIPANSQQFTVFSHQQRANSYHYQEQLH